MKISKISAAIGFFLAGTILGFLLAGYKAGPSKDSSKIAPGTEVISVLEEEVMSLVFTTDSLTFGAQRSQAGGSFSVQVTFADGRRAQQCIASPDLAGLLTTLSTIVVKRQMQTQQVESQFSKKLGKLEIRDRMITERMHPIEIRMDSNQKVLAALYDGTAVEIENPLAAFKKLEAGCEAVGLH